MTAALAIVMVAIVAVPASAQSLAEIAKKEQARRKAIEGAKAAPKKVYTNDDLKPPATPARPAGDTPAAAPPAGTPAEGSGDQQAAADQAKPPQDEKGEEYWRARISQAREELRRNEMFLDALQSRVNALSTDFVNRDDPYQRAQIADDRQKALAEMDRVKQDIETVKKQIADIEEEARQAGVPPGWLR
jgi:hypothetical protein